MIKKTNLPHHSLLNSPEKTYHYIDSFSGTLTDKNNSLDAKDVCKTFFSSAPKWIGTLLTIRNKIVSAFGLKTSGKEVDLQKQLDQFTCEPGEQLGLFKVFSKSDNEVVLGEDDKHLNFRVSLLLDKKSDDPLKKDLIISTVVEFNNAFGRFIFYLFNRFIK